MEPKLPHSMNVLLEHSITSLDWPRRKNVLHVLLATTVVREDWPTPTPIVLLVTTVAQVQGLPPLTRGMMPMYAPWVTIVWRDVQSRSPVPLGRSVMTQDWWMWQNVNRVMQVSWTCVVGKLDLWCKVSLTCICKMYCRLSLTNNAGKFNLKCR